MAILGECARGRRADPLGGTLGRQQLGVGRFERLQLAKQPVVLRVGDLRRVEHVVGVVGAFDLDCAAPPPAPRARRRRRRSPRRGLLGKHGHSHPDQPIHLRRAGASQRPLAPGLFLRRECVEQPPQKAHQGRPLTLGGSTCRILAPAQLQPLEPVRVSERLGRQARDHLAEVYVSLGKRRAVSESAQEDGADGRPPPGNRDDRDVLHLS